MKSQKSSASKSKKSIKMKSQKSTTSSKSRSKKPSTQSSSGRTTSGGRSSKASLKKVGKSGTGHPSKSKTGNRPGSKLKISSRVTVGKGRRGNKRVVTISVVVIVVMFLVAVVYFLKGTDSSNGASGRTSRQTEYAQHFCSNYPGNFDVHTPVLPEELKLCIGVGKEEFSPVREIYDALLDIHTGTSRKALIKFAYGFTKRPVKEPTEHGFTCGRNFFIKFIEGTETISLGAWWIPPQDNCQDTGDTVPADQLVVLFAHGQIDTRDVPERVALYKALTDSAPLKVHLIAFDYRSSGDSSELEPTVQGLVADTLSAYRWLREMMKIDRKQIIFWGHGLGTQVITHALALLGGPDVPLGVVLEAAFPSLNRLFYYILRFMKTISGAPIDFEKVEKIVNNVVNDHKDLLGWDARDNIPWVKCPMLLLSSTFDFIVPHQLSEEVFNFAISPQPHGQPPAVASKTKYFNFGDDEKLSHKEIPKGGNFSAIVKNYFQFIYC